MNWVKQEAPNLNVILEQRGMTLRDYFAAKAMQIYLKAHHDRVLFEEGKYEEATHFWSDEDVATEAYETADAMLEASKYERQKF